MMHISEDLAEFYGAMIGDGCLSIIWNKSEKRLRRIALLSGHMANDYDYYVTVMRPIIKKEFGINGYLQKRPSFNVLYLVMSESVHYALSQMGFPIGLKGDILIPDSIMNDNRLSRFCIRGIFSTDGSIYRRYSKKYKGHSRLYDYLVIQFKMVSKSLIEQISKVLQREGIRTTRITSDREYWVVRVTDQQEIKKFIKTIKPRHPYHLSRYHTKCLSAGP